MTPSLSHVLCVRALGYPRVACCRSGCCLFRKDCFRELVHPRRVFDSRSSTQDTRKSELNCSVCVCVFFPSILDIKFVGRTSRGHTGGRSHRIFNPPSFCGACLDFCREKDSAIPFPRRP